MSSFDPSTFLDVQVTGANDTKIIPIPVGEYLAVTSDVEIKTWQSQDDATKSGVKLVVMMEVDPEARTPTGQTVKEVTGRDKNTVKTDIFLDTMPGGGLDMGKGKNVQLGRLREALGLNDPSQAFSFRQIPGRPIKVMLKHREYKGDMYAEVAGVAKPA